MPSLARDPEIGDVRYQGDTSSKVPYILEYIMGYSCKVSLSSGTYETKGEIRITRNANYYRILSQAVSWKLYKTEFIYRTQQAVSNLIPVFGKVAESGRFLLSKLAG